MNDITEPSSSLFEGRVQAALELLAECLGDEDAWDEPRSLLKQVSP